ncbi:MAG TPA: hypothetical protein DG048_03915 [Pseudoalteromonas sp.]|nr:hypothetical protein [Pseudoalteromonas sp.]
MNYQSLQKLTRVELIALRHNLVLYSDNKEQVAAIDKLLNRNDSFWFEHKRQQQYGRNWRQSF